MLYNIDINKMNKLMSNNEDARQIIPQLLRNHRNTISTISHEIRNPLTLVSSALQVMEKQNPELKDIPHWSQVMGDVDFIIQLLEELSAFNSSNELYYSVFSIEQLLKNVAISFAISLDTNEADIEFSSSISDSLGEFTGDKIKLQELVLNLLKNAEEAITEQGPFIWQLPAAEISLPSPVPIPAAESLRSRWNVSSSHLSPTNRRNRTWTGILPQDCRGSRRNSHCCFHSAGIHYIYRYTSCLGTFLP